MQKNSSKKMGIWLPFTRYGQRELMLLTALMSGAAAAGYHWWPGAPVEVKFLPLALLLVIGGFFRDPPRRIRAGEGVLLAPADGKITDISEVEEPDFIGGRALRIGIFLSVFNVHLNRAPCDGRVAFIDGKPGKFINALKWQAASQENQYNRLGLECPEHPAGKVLVKQITGAIARRIVCACRMGEEVAAGQKFGMIKFGSRTELFIPADAAAAVAVRVGEKVKAGTTVLVKYGVASANRNQAELISSES